MRLTTILFASLLAISLSLQAGSSDFNGTTALANTKQAVAFGERPSGSEALTRTRDWIKGKLKAIGGELTEDAFSGQTPNGPVPMTNLILKFPGVSGKAIVVSGHYDTKRIPMMKFIGANDAGSSTGFLIEFARVMSRRKHSDDIYIVFFDGEEALGAWSETDSRYGSRHLAAKWLSEGMLGRIRALINVDMIGDKDLDLNNDTGSSQSLRNQVWDIAGKLGDAKYFRHEPGSVDDDHRPFVELGVNAIDIIDLDYGPWHTAQDTMDKLSAHSFQVVGDVVLELVSALQQ